MRKKLLVLFALAFFFTPAALTPAVFAQAGASNTGSNGVWTSPGRGAVNLPNENTSARTWDAPVKNNPSAPTVNSVKVDYDEEEKNELLKITGSNFPPYKEKIRVIVDGAQASVQKSDPKLIVALLPKSAGNEAKVTVEMNGQIVLLNKKITIPPRVTGISLMSGPPGTPVTIFGKHFAGKLTDNKVFIGGVEVPVNGGSKSVLSVVIPIGFDAAQPAWGVPVTVQVNGQSSNSDVVIRIQNRVY